MISGEQMRAARAMLRMEQAEVAKKAGVSVETIKRLEAIVGPLREARPETIQNVQTALEYEGIEFIESPNADAMAGEGVRFAEPPTYRYQNLLANLVWELTSSALHKLVQKDPKLFDKDAAVIADTLIKNLVPRIRDTMPTTLKNKQSALQLGTPRKS